ncbi:hypothetical protein [Paenibacillus polymyxa]|uniref:hypothetical protein n=1 Tax=Paenibacillus polymyxa TaxID=1406 RepID=UPI00021BBB34|nr:hypothetical protein [Paenibacillus polymyxa]MDN4106460.1 hypothetical protein [Paenibacillus polymyxa]CCC86222.1 hypothetical protein PPM_p0072 [Paenibacillus polymyxa M1]
MNYTIDLSKFPKVAELVLQSGIQDRQNYIIWTKLSRTETASALAELSLFCRASVSSSISARKRVKFTLNYYKKTIGKKIHPFANSQALEDLGLSQKRMQELVHLQLEQLRTVE